MLVMTLAVYPLVYLPVAASLRGADPEQEEMARRCARAGSGLLAHHRRPGPPGHPRWLPTRRAGRPRGVRSVRDPRVPDVHDRNLLRVQIGFDTNSACALSIVLVLLSLVVLFGENASRGGGRVAPAAGAPRECLPRRRLGKATVPVLLAYTALVGAALGVPVAASVYWIFEGGAHALTGVPLAPQPVTPRVQRCGGSTGHLRRHAGGLAGSPPPEPLVRAPRALDLPRLATPGLVVALALVYFCEQYAGGFAYQTAPLLVFAYALLFFPLALVGVKASVLQVPVALEEVASSLGVGRFGVFCRVTFRLIAPGLGAAFCLVFLSCVTELTATLILIPTGAETLATQFWAYQQNLSYGQAAPFALAIIAIAAVPSYILGRFFDRLPARAQAVSIRRT